MSRFLSMKSPRCKPPRRTCSSCVPFHRPSTMAGCSNRTTWKGKFRKHPGIVEEYEERWTALPTLPTSGTHHVRVSGRRTRVSPSYIAFADRQHEVLPLPERYSRARALLLSPLLLRPPAERAIDLCSKTYRGRKGRREAHLHRDTIMSILSLSTRTRGVQSRNRDACP